MQVCAWDSHGEVKGAWEARDSRRLGLAWGYADGVGDLGFDVIGVTDSLTRNVLTMLMVVVVIVVVVILLFATLCRFVHSWIGARV